MAGEHMSDVGELRRRARQHIEKGAVTSRYGLDIGTAVKLLNEALATELVCVLRYKYHYFMAKGIHAQAVQQEFLEHAAEEQGHADQLAARIVQLGGKPDLNPEVLARRSHAEYVEGDSIEDMIREDLVAERIAIESYGEMIAFFGPRDTSSRRLLEQILAVEEEHAEDLVTLLETYFGPAEGKRPPPRGREQRAAEEGRP
jgi:bacterioferritin